MAGRVVPLPPGVVEVPDPNLPPLPAGVEEVPEPVTMAPDIEQTNPIVSGGSHTPAPDPRGGTLRRLPSYLEVGAEMQAQRKTEAQSLFPGLAKMGVGIARSIASGVPARFSPELSEGAVETMTGLGGAMGYIGAPLDGMTQEFLARRNVPVPTQQFAGMVAGNLPGMAMTGVASAMQAAGRQIPVAGRALIEATGGATKPNELPIGAVRPPEAVTSTPKVVDPYAPVQSPVLPKQAAAQAPLVQPERPYKTNEIIDRHITNEGSTTDPRTGKDMGDEDLHFVGVRPDLTYRAKGVNAQAEFEDWLAGRIPGKEGVPDALRDDPQSLIGTYWDKTEGRDDHVYDVVRGIKDRDEAMREGMTPRPDADGNMRTEDSIWYAKNKELIPLTPETAPAAAVSEPVAVPKKKIRLEHFTPTRGLNEITADQYGTGALSMSERKRGAPPATFLYREGMDPEAKVLARAKGGEILTTEIDEDLLRKLEDTAPDPDALRDVGDEMTAREFAIAKERAAYEGQYGIVKSFGERHPVIARRDVPGAEVEESKATRGTPGIAVMDRATGKMRVFQSEGGMHALAIDRLSLDELRDVVEGRAEFRAGRFDADGQLVPDDRATVRSTEYADQVYKLRLRNPTVRELPPALAKAEEWADRMLAEAVDPNKKYDVGGAVVVGVKQMNAVAVKAAVFIYRNTPTRAEFVRAFGAAYELTKEQLGKIWDEAVEHLKRFKDETSGRLITREAITEGVSKGDPLWYETGAPALRERMDQIFDPHPYATGEVKPVDRELAEMGAVASPKRAVPVAERLGLDAMLHRRLGVPTSDELEGMASYRKYMRTGIPGGPKVGPFAEARYAGLLGEAPTGPAVIDRHMLRAGGFPKLRQERPRIPQRQFLQGMYEAEAAERAAAGHPADTPVRAQAAHWTGMEHIEDESKRPWAEIVNEYLDKDEDAIRTALKDKRDLDEATSFNFGANVKEMHTFPSLKALEDAGARIRDTGFTRETKERLGTREERYQAIYNDKATGSAIRAAEGQMEAQVALQKAKDSEYVKTLTKDLTPERRKATFDVGEAIREFDEQGNPVFGTTKVDESVRYDAATGKKMWDDLSPDEQNLVRIVKAAYEHQKETENVISTIVGYMPHVKANEVATTWDKLRYLWEPPGTPNTLQRPAPKNQPTVLKAKKAGPRMKRTDANDDYVHDIASSLEYSLHQFTKEREYNKFLKQLVLVGTRPYDPKVGLVSDDWMVIPKTAATRSGQVVAQVGGGRQIPKNMWAEIAPRVDHAQATKKVGELVSVFRDLGNYSRMNMLTLNPGSISRNSVGGGVQYGTMMMEHLFRGMLDLDLSQFTNDVKGLADAFRLDVIKERPEGLFGARSNTRTQYDPPTTKLGEFGQKGMEPFAAVENYFKRAIMQSQLRQVGAHKLTAQQVADNRALLQKANQAIDQWAFNYSEIPKGLEGLRKSALGSLAMPFPVYGYKIARMYGRYAAALNPVVEMSRKDRVARILTLSAIAAPLLYARSKTKEGTLERGRVAVGGGLGMRTMETPWVGPWVNPTKTAQQAVSVGPLAQAALAAGGMRNEYNQRDTMGTIMGQTLGTFLPGARLTASVRDIIESYKGNPRSFPQNFWQAAGRHVPGTPTMGKKAKKKLEPGLEWGKALAGINLERGHERK